MNSLLAMVNAKEARACKVSIILLLPRDPTSPAGGPALSAFGMGFVRIFCGLDEVFKLRFLRG